MPLIRSFFEYHALTRHEDQPGDRTSHGDWILAQTAEIWASFAATFADLWRTERNGILYPSSLFEDQGHTTGSIRACADRLDLIRVDALGFAGIEMHRRILGLAHNADFEVIADEARRARCEMRALLLGRDLILNRNAVADMAGLQTLTRAHAAKDPL